MTLPSSAPSAVVYYTYIYYGFFPEQRLIIRRRQVDVVEDIPLGDAGNGDFRHIAAFAAEPDGVPYPDI